MSIPTEPHESAGLTFASARVVRRLFIGSPPGVIVRVGGPKSLGCAECRAQGRYDARSFCGVGLAFSVGLLLVAWLTADSRRCDCAAGFVPLIAGFFLLFLFFSQSEIRNSDHR